MTFPVYLAYKDSGVEWLGEVPEHWAVHPLKRAIERIESGTSVNAADFPAEPGSLGVLKTSCVYTGKFDWAENKTVDDEDLSRVSCPLRKDTLIVSRMNTPDLVGATGLVTEAPNGIFLPDRLWQVYFLVNHSPEFLFYFSKSREYREQVKMACSGTSASMQNLGQDDFRGLLFAEPPKPEQTQIARFLDHETARIDALIEEQQRLIELLKEKRQAVISHAVTKGLDPTVPMKDSGVEWLGEVPAHWEVLQFRRGFTFLTDYEANGSFAATKEMVNLDEGEPYAWFVRATDLENGRIGLIQGNRYCDETSYQFLSKTKLDGGELLIAKRGEIGKVYQLPELSCRATLAPNLYSIKLSKKIITQFAFYWFSSGFGRPQLELANKSTTIGALYKDDVRALICIFPPVSEQHEITKRVDEQVRHVDLMIAEAEKIISLSSERRSALISAAVTGKIDVRGWQPPANTPAPEPVVAEVH
jgi:type I restriction enzyme S subunit